MNSSLPYFPLFPRARFSLLIGDPGAGKSLLAAHLAARRSLRSPFPPDPFLPNPLPDETIPPADHPGFSLICSREDDPETLDYRLSIAAGGTSADTRFTSCPHMPTLIAPKPEKRSRHADQDNIPPHSSPFIAELIRLIQRHGPIGLLILDPLPAFLDTVDASNNPALIRRALTPLIDFCHARNITLVGISHLIKNPRSRAPIFHAANSFAYSALARSVLLLTHDTLTHDPLRRILIPLKNTFGTPASAYSFTLHSKPIDGTNISFPFLTLDPAPILNHPLLPIAAAFPGHPIKDSALEFAEHFLKTTLLDGPLPSSQLLSEARSLGITSATLQRARESLQTCSFRTKKRWLTHLPNLAPPDYDI
jgi:hypothetical protein